MLEFFFEPFAVSERHRKNHHHVQDVKQSREQASTELGGLLVEKPPFLEGHEGEFVPGHVVHVHVLVEQVVMKAPVIPCRYVGELFDQAADVTDGIPHQRTDEHTTNHGSLPRGFGVGIEDFLGHVVIQDFVQNGDGLVADAVLWAGFHLIIGSHERPVVFQK